MSSQNQAVTLTAEQLKDLMLTMAKELRKPADPTPEELAQAENDRKSRESTAKLQLEKLEREQANRMACTHRRKDRTTSMVYEYMGGYLICQQCQAIVHPGVRPGGDAGKETANHFYDTRLFNEHFVETQAGMTTF